jgi:hypothetical protein
MQTVFRQECDEGGLFKFTLRQKGGIQVFLDEHFSDARVIVRFQSGVVSWIRPSMTLLPHAMVAVWAE